MSAGQLVRTLRQYADITEKGQALLAGTPSEKKLHHSEMRSYLDQALTYFRVAESIEGSPGALPLYYSCLNLAKAELLRTQPAQIYKKKIQHGLSYDPDNTRTIRSDFVTVRRGVFPLLYRARTGRTLPLNTKLRIRRLLANIPEIGWELDALGLGPTNIAPILHTVAADQTSAWSLIATQNGSFLGGSSLTATRFRQHYDEVLLPQPHTAGPMAQPILPWRATFAVTARHMSVGQRFFQGRWTRPAMDSAGGVVPDVQVAADVFNRLSPWIEASATESHDADIVGSMYAQDMLPMPSSLARYAAIFYFSSLVRYKPSRVDRRETPDEGWMADALCDQSREATLRDSVAGITGRPQLFRSAASMRT